MYETPFYAKTAREGTTFHDFTNKQTFRSQKPTLVTVLTADIRTRLQDGALIVTDENGKKTAGGKLVSHKRGDTVVGLNAGKPVPVPTAPPVPPVPPTPPAPVVAPVQVSAEEKVKAAKAAAKAAKEAADAESGETSSDPGLAELLADDDESDGDSEPEAGQ